MNKFWGRNEEGSIPKFTRDDEQILALNYENLCDADYLSRLFISDEFYGNQDTSDIISDSNDPVVNTHGSSLFSSELSEDLMLFGDSPEMSKVCFERRFNKEINSTGKTHDSISSVVKRQVIVFEHIGQLMLNRCMHSNDESSKDKVLISKPVSKVVDANNKSTIDSENSLVLSNHVVSDTLSCALSILLRKINIPKNGKGQFSFKKSILDGLLSILFQICEESRNSSLRAGDALPQTTATNFHPSLLGNLRKIFVSCIFSCLNFSTIRQDGQVTIYASGQLVEENIKLAFSCFYGLLLIGSYFN